MKQWRISSGARPSPSEVPSRYSAGAFRRASRSPQTKANASAPAAQASLFPIDRKLARLTRVSRESLASAAEFHRATSPAPADLAATTVPNPKTRSLMPIVLMSKTEAAVGSSLPDKRIGASGATTSTTPTKARSHPIASCLAIGTHAAYPTKASCQGPYSCLSRRRPEYRLEAPYPAVLALRVNAHEWLLSLG